MERLLCVLIGYVCGLFQTSYLIGKSRHIDIRQHGSGNAGSTNALRVMGAKAGAMTLAGDCLKCVIAVLLARAVYGGTHPDELPLLTLYAAAGCILGHNFPFYLGFRGGKGIAASVGMIIAFDWKLLLVCAVVFIGLYLFTHYVSLCSIVTYITALVMLVVFGELGYYGMDRPHTLEMYAVMAALTFLAIFRHRKNIQRLLSGSENKTYLKKSGKKS